MTQDTTVSRDTKHIFFTRKFYSRGTERCRHIIINLVIPQSKRCFVSGHKIYKEKLAPHIHKHSSHIRDEAIKIHKKQNWFKRCGRTLIDNAAGLSMAMLAGKIVQNQVEVQEFGNLWGLLATRPVVSEGTYEMLSFTAEFIIALIVFTLTEHFLEEYRQRKHSNETLQPAAEQISTEQKEEITQTRS